MKYNSQGKHTFLHHAKGDQHKLNADGRQGRLKGQAVMVPSSVNDQNENAEVGDGGVGGAVDAGAGVGGDRVAAKLI